MNFEKLGISTNLFFARFFQNTTEAIATNTIKHPNTRLTIPTVVLNKGIGDGMVGLVAFTVRMLNT